MCTICPTVTAFNPETYNQQLKLAAGFSNRIHIDLMDGVFAPTKSPDIDNLWIPKDVLVDIHVMYQNPNNILDKLMTLHPSMIILHAESEIDLPYTSAILRDNNIKSGVALLPKTSANDVGYVLPHVQHALIFGGNLGYHGGDADLSQLSKVTELKQLNRFLEIGWDGGANLDNVLRIKNSSVDVINVGSAIHSHAEPQEAFLQLSNMIS